jgi:hypothetical protein
MSPEAAGISLIMHRIPWGRTTTAVLLVAAFAIAVKAGRTIEAAIIGVLTVPAIVLLVLYVVAWRRGLLDDDS